MDTAHRAALGLKHAQLEQRLVEEMRRPVPSQTALQALKKQKLKLKEGMLE